MLEHVESFKPTSITEFALRTLLTERFSKDFRDGVGSGQIDESVSKIVKAVGSHPVTTQSENIMRDFLARRSGQNL